MNKKTLLKFIISSLFCTLTLTSCGLLEAIAGALDNATGDGNDSIGTDTNNVSLVIEPGLAGKNTSLQTFKEKEGYEIFPSLGEQHLLVIPVYFSDYAPSKCFSETADEARNNINKAFFGTSSTDSDSSLKTGWESVASYYEKSSYGKLKITGEVTNWFAYDKTLKAAAKDNKQRLASTNVLREAVSWYKRNNPDKVSYYDQDNDGYLDGVVLIYANEYSTSANNKYKNYVSQLDYDTINDFCWAYTSWDNQGASTISPVANVYLWASYSFMWDGGYTESTGLGFFGQKKLVDAHTYIHEFGHVMGLDDYYDYDDTDYSPLGRCDMMDYNIGDHNAYSKYLLGWLEPTLVDKEGTYEIKSAQEYPSALLVPAKMSEYGYSAFNQYLLVEFYTPTGNNYADSMKKYMGTGSSYPYMYTQYGIKLLLVDSRMVVQNLLNNSRTYTKTANIDLGAFKSIFIGASNTPSYSINSKYRLISLLSSNDGVTDYSKRYSGASANSDLYTEGKTEKNVVFDDGTVLGYDIKIDSIDRTNYTASITFTAKEK